MKLYNS